METVTVHVGWTSTRPIRPDEHVSAVEVAVEPGVDPTLVACQVVACRPECEMVTGVLAVEI